MLKERLKLLDKWIVIPFIVLILFSIIAVYSASNYSAMEEFGNPNYYLVRQSIVVFISLFIAFFVYIFPFRVLKKKKTILFGTVVIFALLTIVFFLPARLGARRWIPLPVFNLQPAEFAKVFVIWYLAYIFSRNQKELESEFLQTIMKPSILVGAIFFLILLEPDTGTAIIIALITVSMLSASGASLKYGLSFILFGVLLVGGLTFIIYKFGDSIPILGYRYDRFLGLWDPFGYYESYGNQLVNSYYALSRGRIFGVGIGNSVQKTGYLPFPYTDFIMAIIGEELGLAGVTAILVALGMIIGRAFYLGSRSKDSFNSLIYIGVGSMLLSQTLINLAGLTGLIPITGVTFPLLSYGGSSLLVVSISIALIANASTQDRLNEKKLKKN
ncbi:MAG TPA: FtsW/RodA/SpoVE family cell cycle protein [Candidatus Atopostipes pullistercoris]|uniref:Probable peptidoglycan glycosyltransferase FtsW n=1 Tax=Candidatus Atopostipes pullistercoris TaxID=2838467 RepID=A0A9D2G3H6_9LACT|nr:FtsW/RodA/SpoVE family cell cycle protein [Candidatus Atopostipes pullistercoris]